MLISIISAGIIIFGSTYIGVSFANKYELSVNQIVGFINALKMLEFDISYLRLPLNDAFERIAKGQNGVVKSIFEYMAKELSSKKCEDVGILFKRAISNYEKELLIGEEATAVLYDFSKNMGCMDVENEIANIKTASMKLKYFEEEAREKSKYDGKMCRGLGLLTGIFIVIMLI